MNPILTPGREAYERGDYDDAASRFATAARRLASNERELALALAELARARRGAAPARARGGGAAERARARRAADVNDLDAAVPALVAACGRLAPLPKRVAGIEVARLRHTLEGEPAMVLGRETIDLHVEPHRPRRTIVRFGILVAILVGGFLVSRLPAVREQLAPANLLPLLDRLGDKWWAPLALLGLYLVLCPAGIPATPLIFVGGAVFGVLWGGTLNFLGLYFGAILTFFLARHLGREFVERYGGSKLRKAEQLLQRHGFWAVVGIRFVPLPFPLANAAAAVTGIRLPVFLVATATGLAPTIFLWTYFADALAHLGEHSKGELLGRFLLMIGLLLVVALTPIAVRRIRRWQRYRALLVTRDQARDRRAAARAARG